MKERELYRYICDVIRSSGVSVSSFENLVGRYEVVLFGGSVRDYVYDKEKCKIRDLDFVFDGFESRECLYSALKGVFGEENFGFNQFGGIKSKKNGLVLDCWRLEDTYAYKKRMIQPTIDNLLQTVFLNIDQYAYNISRNEYVGECNLRKFPEQLDIVLYIEECMELNLVRAMVYSRKYRLPLSKRLQSMIRETLAVKGKRDDLDRIQLRHFGKKIIDYKPFVEKGYIYD